MTTPTDWSDEYKALVRRQFAEQSLADADLAKLKHICLSKGLDPLSGDVHCIKRGGKVSIEVSVHGLLKMCASQMAGSETLWFDSKGNGNQIWLQEGNPAGCMVKLWRRGCSQPFIATALMADYNTGRSMWKNLPVRMIEKVATAQCLRLGFADLAGGLYSPEEMPEADEQPEQPVSAPTDSSSSNSKKPASKKKAAPTPAAKANTPAPDPLAERKDILQRKLQAYAEKDKDLRKTWVASMCERFEAAKAVEVLNIDWLHTDEQVTHTELFVTQYQAQLQQNQAKTAA